MFEPRALLVSVVKRLSLRGLVWRSPTPSYARCCGRCWKQLVALRAVFDENLHIELKMWTRAEDSG